MVIAGGGIAGLTAGMTAARLGRKTLVLTGDVPGGQLMSIEKIDGYPGFPEGVPGYDLCPMLQDQAAAAGAEFMMTGLDRLDAQDGQWRVTTRGGRYFGARRHRRNGIVAEKARCPGRGASEGEWRQRLRELRRAAFSRPDCRRGRRRRFRQCRRP